MNITQYALSEAARRLRKVKSNKLPVLSYVRCTRDVNGTHFTSTDLDRFLTISFPSVIGTSALSRKLAAMQLEREQCDFLIPIDTLVQVAKAADKSSTIKLTPDGFRYVTQGIEAFTAIASEINVTEFPVHNCTWDEQVINSIPLRRAIADALPFASTDDTRQAIRGVYYAENGDIVATDGRRMFVREGLPAPKRSAIIPTETCALIEENMTYALSRVDKDETAWVRFAADNSGLIVRLVSRLIDASYPNYVSVIPRDDQARIHVRVNAEQFHAALSKATICDPKDKQRKTELDIGGGSVTTRGAKGSFTLPANITPQAGVSQSTGIVMVFNGAFLQDIFSLGLGRIALSESLHPAVFTSPAKPGVKVILMPMRDSVSTPAPVEEEEEVEA